MINNNPVENPCALKKVGTLFNFIWKMPWFNGARGREKFREPMDGKGMIF